MLRTVLACSLLVATNAYMVTPAGGHSVGLARASSAEMMATKNDQRLKKRRESALITGTKYAPPSSTFPRCEDGLRCSPS